MTPLSIDRFDEFFSALNHGATPFSWQVDLVRHTATTGTWPDQIVAPTGAGKSSVVEIHLFLNALAAEGAGRRVPRRLSLVVNRRALVDNQAQRAKLFQSRLQSALAGENESPILHQVAQALASLGSSPDKREGPFLLGHLRGELPDRFLPVDDPAACAVIAATPDMYGSRLLFRGYGSSRFARPRDTAILAMDNVLVLDEAHLSRQLLVTARRIAEIQSMEADLGIPRLQVVETTATSVSEVAEGHIGIGVDPRELTADRDVPLSHRVHSEKSLTVIPVERWNGKPANRPVITAIVEEVRRQASLQRDDAHRNQVIGCVVNHVDSALLVSKLLEKAGLNVLTLVGRMRPYDVEEKLRVLSDLQTPDGKTNLNVVVATQTLEVGVDVDFAGLVTELAPGSSLAQRFGRVNRRGLRAGTEVAVVVPENPRSIKPQHPPYSGADLQAALEWLETLAVEGQVNPAALDSEAPPAETPRRLLFQRPERYDVAQWARTGDLRFDEDDLDLWLNDSLDAETTQGGVVVRKGLPSDDLAAAELVTALKPEAREVFPANLSLVRQIMEKVLSSDAPRAFLLRDDDVELLTEVTRLRPGDVLIIDDRHRVTTNHVIVEQPVDYAKPRALWPERVLTVHVLQRVGDREPSKADDFRMFRHLTPEEATEEWQSRGNEGAIVKSTSVLDLDGRGDEVINWFYVEKELSPNEDSEVRQVWSPSRGRVLLSRHQDAVAARAGELSEKVGLVPEFRDAVVEAARLHDEGKRDPRFQSFLGRRSGEPELAKSRVRSRQQAKIAAQRSGLPQGWRHEQLSALISRHSHSADELVTRIVGCSHGRGRTGFPHALDDLLADETDVELRAEAGRLFLNGEWDALVERTNRTVGEYAVSYLEAVERAADAQVSSEGR